jgi:hypothetical protein
MYTICRYEKAWHVDRVSPWCAAFSEDELKVSLNSLFAKSFTIRKEHLIWLHVIQYSSNCQHFDISTE